MISLDTVQAGTQIEFADGTFGTVVSTENSEKFGVKIKSTSDGSNWWCDIDGNTQKFGKVPSRDVVKVIGVYDYLFNYPKPYDGVVLQNDITIMRPLRLIRKV